MIRHVIDLGNDTITSEYSEVLFFFTPNWPSLYHLALVRTFPVLSEGRFLYRSGKGRLQIISIDDIQELLGTILSKGREYLTSQHEPFLNDP